MSLIGFRDRRLAVRLKGIAQNPDALLGSEGLRVTDVFLFKAPDTGIDGRSGTTLGKATCDAYYLAFDGADADITELVDTASDTLTATVFNMSTSPVAADAYIQAVRINGLYVANWEDCG